MKTTGKIPTNRRHFSRTSSSFCYFAPSFICNVILGFFVCLFFLLKFSLSSPYSLAFPTSVRVHRFILYTDNKQLRKTASSSYLKCSKNTYTNTSRKKLQSGAQNLTSTYHFPINRTGRGLWRGAGFQGWEKEDTR